MPSLLLGPFSLHFAPQPDGSLPTKLLVAKWGLNKSVKGDYIVNEVTVRDLPRNLVAVGHDTTDLDFEHNTVPGSPAYKESGEPRKRAAKGSLQVVPGEGVYLHTAPADWTPEGAASVKGRHYSDLSPAILTNDRREVTFIHSVALARHGATEGLELELNSVDGLSALLSPDSTQPVQHHTMDYKKILLALLGLQAEATEAEVHTAAGAFHTKLSQTPAAAVPATLTTQLETMSTTLKDLQTKLESREREALIKEAIRSGKLVPNSVQDLPLAKLSAVLDELPANVVPMDKRTPEGIKLHSTAGLSNSEDVAAEASVKKQLGISDATWAKHNAA